MHATQPQPFAYVQQPWAYSLPVQAPAPAPQPQPPPAPTLNDVIHTLDVHTKQMNAMVETIVSNLNDLSERLAVVEQRVGIQLAASQSPAPQTPPAPPPKQESPVIAKVDRVIERLDGLIGRLEQTAHEQARLNDLLHDVIVQLKARAAKCATSPAPQTREPSAPSGSTVPASSPTASFVTQPFPTPGHSAQTTQAST